MDKQVPDWFKKELTAGLQLLLALNLEFAPASDAILATASAWVKVLYKKLPLENNAENIKRIRQAFYDLSVECERFPTPARFLKSLPPYKAPVPLLERKPISDAQRLRNSERAKLLLKTIKAGRRINIEDFNKGVKDDC